MAPLTMMQLLYYNVCMHVLFSQSYILCSTSIHCHHQRIKRFRKTSDTNLRGERLPPVTSLGQISL